MMTRSSNSERLPSGTRSDDAFETLVTSNEVSPEQSAAYEAADQALNEAAARFPGFAGARVSRPRPGSRAWSTMVRFNSKADMDRWLNSPERAAGLAALYRATDSHHASVVPTGFGSWFAVNAEAGIEAPAWKQAMIVLAVLFPTVMLLGVTFGDLAASWGVPSALSVFVGNALSIVAMTWLLMPVVTRLMAWWLSPRCPPRDTWRGTALLTVAYLAEVGTFLLLV
jgi:antibiotic biosynthesis monooxygenase (ABM) superfamily enzyme